MSLPTVVYDACVLYPAPLRDLLVRLALTRQFQAKWTDEIHDEWTRNVLANRPDLTPPQVNRTRGLMDRHVRDCKVTGHMARVPTLSLPDPDDRHVLAAAIDSGARRIVTFNLSDFPAVTLEPYRISAVHPDAFVAGLLATDPAPVVEVFRNQRAALRHPPIDVAAFLATMEQQRLPQTVRQLRSSSDLI